MSETMEWSTAPKDVEINAHFDGGSTSRARWNVGKDEWEVCLSTGKWVPMKYDRGSAVPIGWSR